VRPAHPALIVHPAPDVADIMKIRTAELRDLAELLEIYNYEVEHGTATLDIQPRTQAQWEAWFFAHNIENHPLIVAEKNGNIAGYASLSAYRQKEAYCSTVELSVYVHPDFRKSGVATKLLEEILEMARQDESIHTVVSVITSENQASVHLHEKFNFSFCGTVREVGMKFGRYLDILQYQLIV